MFKNSLSILFAILFTNFLAAQTGVISGKILDTKIADVVIGATVRLDEGATGVISDIDGNYTINKVSVGKHKITISYLGYTTKTIEDIDVKDGQSTIVDISMEETLDNTITEVVVVAKASRESQAALTLLQKNSASLADGISSETIRRTPDRTTGDVIRRVSGASIQDNRFVIIRGLNDRYNAAMLNGAMLPSTEPDRRAFSFDLFPSNLLDNLMVMKTASPDLPGEFAGGVILLNTKDIPEENYVHASLSAGYNTISTFKGYNAGKSGNLDWLGFDDNSRALPQGFADVNTFKTLSKTDKVAQSKLLANDWATQKNSSLSPNTNMQITTGITSESNKKVVAGATISMTYNNQNRLQQAIRQDFDATDTLYVYNDEIFKNNVLWGAMLNSGVKINNRQKLILQANYSTNSENSTTLRNGLDLEQDRFIQSSSIEYVENHLFTSRIGGEHLLGEKNYKMTWGFGTTRTERDIPSMRRTFYTKNFDANAEEPFKALLPVGSANPTRNGRFYANLTENGLNGNLDFAIPFALMGQKQTFKTGGFYQSKSRVFDARVMGFVRARVAGFDQSLLSQTPDKIFAAENISENGFVVDEITNPSDHYEASSDLAAAYAMFDNKFGERVRLVWGARMENFSQRLQSIDYTGAAIDLKPTTTNLLPSANLTFIANDKNQVRLAASQTVSRPEFRELAPFSFYDFALSANVIGNPTLKSTKIANLDLRYEYFPGSNQMLSAGVFYKSFENPIEFTFNSTGAGSREFTYKNIGSAKAYGVEAEIRKNLGFVSSKLEGLVFFTNIALIRSSLDLSNVSAFDENRAMQGQSPYLINSGLTYILPDLGLSTTLVYNRIGDRVAQVGVRGLYADTYERSRNLLDFQISKRIGEKGELKLNFGDILRPDYVFYQDNDMNHRFDEATDNVMQRFTTGSNISLSFGYKF